MKEEDVANQLAAYADAIGVCRKTPAFQNSRRALVLAPLGVFLLLLVAFALWPRDATAAALRRLGAAIANAKSMAATMSFEDNTGKTETWQRLLGADGMWRVDLVAPKARRTTLIFRDGLCYTDFADQDHATVGPVELAIDRPPTGGEALDVVKDELTRHFARGSTCKLASSEPVNGKAAYKVLFDRPDRHQKLEILVDRATNLPLSADIWFFTQPRQHVHWAYAFNVPVPAHAFDLPAGRKIVDLRKTLPALEAKWKKPLASVGGFKVFDACVTKDGMIWIATKTREDEPVTRCPDDLKTPNGPRYTYGGGIVEAVKLSHQSSIRYYGYAPLGPVRALPTTCTASVKGYTKSHYVSPTSDDMTAMEQLPSAGRLNLKLRKEPGLLPAEFANLGLEDRLSDNYTFEVERTKAGTLDQAGRFAEAAPIYERFGRQSTSRYGGYFSWLEQAARCYDAAGMKAKARALRVEIAAARAKQGS